MFDQTLILLAFLLVFLLILIGMLVGFGLKWERRLAEFREKFDLRQFESLKAIQDSIQQALTLTRSEIRDTVSELTKTTEKRLDAMSSQVEKRLSEGFEKTNETFGQIIQRLSLIDHAQQKITELSQNVTSLQDVLNDKRSRGAFGEVQLGTLIRNMLPENHFKMQHTLSNQKRVDCMIFLPKPSGNIAVDAKFPLETYQKLNRSGLSHIEKTPLEAQFRQDIKKHIQDIAEKYIVPGETADGAILFLPSEAIFAEIHAYYPELVEEAQKRHVWLVSPTTMMAVLTTACAVLKDEATQKQVHIIQEHLQALGKDFERFQQRMEALSKHIAQAHEDVEQVNTSARKISSRFAKIEKVELETERNPTRLEESSS